MPIRQTSPVYARIPTFSCAEDLTSHVDGPTEGSQHPPCTTDPYYTFCRMVFSSLVSSSSPASPSGLTHRPNLPINQIRPRGPVPPTCPLTPSLDSRHSPIDSQDSLWFHPCTLLALNTHFEFSNQMLPQPPPVRPVLILCAIFSLPFFPGTSIHQIENVPTTHHPSRGQGYIIFPFQCVAFEVFAGTGGAFSYLVTLPVPLSNSQLPCPRIKSRGDPVLVPSSYSLLAAVDVLFSVLAPPGLSSNESPLFYIK